MSTWYHIERHYNSKAYYWNGKHVDSPPTSTKGWSDDRIVAVRFGDATSAETVLTELLDGLGRVIEDSDDAKEISPQKIRYIYRSEWQDCANSDGGYKKNDLVIWDNMMWYAVKDVPGYLNAPHESHNSWKKVPRIGTFFSLSLEGNISDIG